MLRSQFISLLKNGTHRVLANSVNNAAGVSQAPLSTGSTDGGGGQVAPPPSTTVPDTAPSLGGKGIDGWQIMAAVCVTRHPIVCPPMSPLEHTYSQHLIKLEMEHSIMSDFELKLIEDNARKMLGDTDEVELVEAEVEQSALENLDMWKQEEKDFEQIRNYSLDVSESSIGTSLCRQVVLVQRYQVGSQDMWLLPQGPWKPGETLRQTSERIVAESCDPALGVRIMGNAPVGFFKYKYPKEMRVKGYIGAKVFFYRGQVSNRVRQSLPLLHHRGKDSQLWLTHPQIRDKLKTSYVKALTQFLIDDS